MDGKEFQKLKRGDFRENRDLEAVRGRATGGTNYSGAGNSTQVNHRQTARHDRGNTQGCVFGFAPNIQINTAILNGTRRFHHPKGFLC